MLTQYNAKDCTIMMNSIYLTGLSEDMVTGEKDEEFFENVVGAQGDIVMNEINNTLGTITLTVQITCPQKKMILDLAKSGSIFPMWVVNKSIGERMGGTQCRVKNFPELTHGATGEDREIEIAVMDYTVEGL